MSSLWRLPVAENHNFGQILTFGVFLYRPPFTDEDLIWYAKAEQRSTLTRQFSSEYVHCGGFGWPKTTILGKCWHFWGAPVPNPFYRRGPNLVCIADTKYTFTCQISSQSVYSVALWRQKPPNFCQFLQFFGIRHLVLSPIGNSLTKLNMGAQLQTFP